MTTPDPLELPRDGWPSGPARLALLAGPGCGKTRALLEGWLVPALRGGVDARRMLAVTFSKAAALELRERLARELKLTASSLEGACSTLHAHALRVLLADGGELVLLAARRARKGDDAEELTPEAALAEEAEADPALRAHEYARHTGSSLAEALARVAPALREPLAARRVREYEARRDELGAVDFTGLLEDFAALVPEPLELLVIDEAQDLTPLLARCVELLAERARVVVAAGDPDQALYRWAGARSSWLALDLPAAGFAVRRLERSHRLPLVVSTFARAALAREPAGAYAPTDRAGRVRVALFAEAVDRLVRAGRDNERALVLSRTRHGLSRWARALSLRAVPFTSSRTWSPLSEARNRTLARTTHALRAGEGVSLFDALALVDRLARLDKREERPTLPTSRREFTREDLEALGVDLARALEPRTLAQALEALGLARGTAQALAALADAHGREVFSLAPAVDLSTYHGSKGREAPLVVVDVTTSRATRRALANRGDEARAEREALYVAATRSAGELLLVRAPRDLLALLDLERPLRQAQEATP